MSNNDYPTTRGMTDAEVHARQMASIRVTATSTRPVCVRFSKWQLPLQYHWRVSSPASGGRIVA